jgi:ABC-type multidrug transport system ATPase subunit
MLIGRNGSGKSTLLKIILDEESADEGNIALGSRVEIGYLAQQQYPKDPKQSVLAYFRREAGMEEGEARSRLAAYLFYGADVFKPVSLLSGGEWTRLRLALLVLRKPNLLILDEPTNHMDVASREALEEALEEYPGTILAVTHDRYLINRLSRKIWELDRGRINVHLGDFDDYKTNGKRKTATEASSSAKERLLSGEPRSERRPKPRNQEIAERGQANLEAEIAGLEQSLIEWDARLNELAESRDPAELERIWTEREAVRAKLNDLYEEWMSVFGG